MIPRIKVDYANPNYDGVYRERLRRLETIRTEAARDPNFMAALKAYYRDNPADFIDDWGATFDPRNIEVGRSAAVPFILFPRQREWIEWLIENWRDRRPGLTEKSRDCGASWVAVALGCTMCLHYRGMVIGYGSRKENYVDETNNPKSLFFKARMFMQELPVDFRGGWQRHGNAAHMRITFPETGSAMTGEAGDNIGRGDRTSMYFVDEAQPLSARVMTPDGWRAIADIQPGSIVFGCNGRPTKVRQIKDCGVHDVFRVTFGDGTVTKCSPNHLWTVDKVHGKRERLTLRAHEIAETLSYRSPGGQTQYRYRVPTCAPVEFGRRDALPLDPYVVGALLGDGSLKGTTIRLTSADREVIDRVSMLLPAGVVFGAFDGRYSYNIRDVRRPGRMPNGDYVRSRIHVAIEAAGIPKFGSPQKFIPEIYKFASPDNRLSILQGLMDTDGSATGGSSGFHTSSARLAEDVRFIVQSLGGTATHNVKPDARGYRPMHDVHLMLPNGMVPFRLSRKIAKLRPRRHPPDRTIVAMERIGRLPVRCITVAAEDGLYLTDNFIVTHNSAFLERPQLVEASLSATTNCRQDVSTPNGRGNPFEQKRHGGKIRVFTFHWRNDPRKDDAWYQKQLEDLTDVVVAQEIDINYSASVEGVLIPHPWILAAVDACEKLGIKPTGRRAAGLDVADEGVDLNAICGATGVQMDHLEEWSGKGSDIMDTVRRSFAICDRLGYSMLTYDGDGLGAGVRGDARTINDERKKGGVPAIQVQAFRATGPVVSPEGEDVKGRKNEDFFGNFNAQAWWSVRMRFQRTYRWIHDNVRCGNDDIISIPSKLPLFIKLIGELSQPTYALNNAGKVVVDKKPEGARSPNLADAVKIRFASPGTAPMVITPDILAKSRMISGGLRRR